MRQAIIAGGFIFAFFLSILFRLSDVSAVSSNLSISFQPAPQIAQEKEGTGWNFKYEAIDTNNKEAVSSSVEYSLPYPGMLPDHPLYFLKAFRDKVLEFLIRDPKHKAEFYLLMTDKKLNMGVFLKDKGKFQLAQETVIDGEEYFIKGIAQIKEAKVKASQIPNKIKERYNSALKKHTQVIKDLQKNSPENTKLGYNKLLDRLEKTKQEITKLGN